MTQILRDLPTFYYLDHFNEFLQFVIEFNEHLLHDKHKTFLTEYFSATKEQQCLLVRCINRKSRLIRKSTLQFSELNNIDDLTKQLTQLAWLREISAEDKNDVINIFTKEELFALYAECSEFESVSPLKKSIPKLQLQSACHALIATTIPESATAKRYLARNCDDCVDYFLFLYFGNCRDRLNQFSLRDLGVMKTRDTQVKSTPAQSRFECKQTALMMFTLQNMKQRLKTEATIDNSQINALIQQIPDYKDAASEAIHYNIKFKLAHRLLTHDRPKALDYLLACKDPLAQEKWCREAYKDGKTEQVEHHLNTIIDAPLSDQLLIFAEDFLARKYQKKRTSIMTDMLRQNNQHIRLDEIHKGRVEHGVVEYYENQNKRAFKTENNLWRALFGLTFWPVLFETPGLGLTTEFDYLPECLKQDCFYTKAKAPIKRVLASLDTPKKWLTHLAEIAAANYAFSQSIFHWHPTLIDELAVLVRHSDLSSISAVLLNMCRAWHQTNDGFPDLMVLDDNKLRFEEVKGEGDVLRRNQLLRIQQMREAGFNVLITTVDFTIDPLQPYVVVDIETTGGRAQHHKITEIGMVKVIAGEIVDQWQSLINPLRFIPSNITQLTGIDNDMVKDAPIFFDVAEKVDDFTKNAIFVAHNVNFDYGFIREEFARIDKYWRRPKLCTVQQMRKHYKGLKSYSLANLTAHFDITMETHHRAMSDAVAASELLNLVNAKRSAPSM